MDYAFISIAANVFISSYEPVVVSIDITTWIRVAAPALSIECMVALINAIWDYASYSNVRLEMHFNSPRSSHLSIISINSAEASRGREREKKLLRHLESCKCMSVMGWKKKEGKSPGVKLKEFQGMCSIF